jgi:hypothetical protein
LDGALEHYQKALDIQEQHVDQKTEHWLACSYLNVCSILHSKDDYYERALSQFMKPVIQWQHGGSP